MTDQTQVSKETLEGYVVDITCLRTAPSSGLEEMAEEHTTACALMGHCIESGYGLVRKDGSMALLDPKATLHVVKLLTHTTSERGMWLRVERQQNSDKMETISALEVVDVRVTDTAAALRIVCAQKCPLFPRFSSSTNCGYYHVGCKEGGPIAKACS